MSISLSNFQIDYEIISIVTNSLDEKVLNPLIETAGLFTKEIETQLQHKLLRLSKEKIKVACQIIGCKPSVAQSISDRTLTRLQETVNSQVNQPPLLGQAKQYMYTTKTKFFKLFKEELEKAHYYKERNLLDFQLALSILEQNRSMIVLLGGTSGSGKSTVASLLASRFGIPTVLSTDSIRHVMRNFMSAEDCPVLFCSTYEAGSKIKLDEGVKESKRIVVGFQQQAAAVQQRLESILEDFYNRGESIVVEGVHLTPDFLTAMVKRFDNCVPFLIYISNENKHRERFAVRSKYMTLEKRHNKYVQNFSSIRCIQKHLIKKADEYLIPKVDNSNVDKSVGLVHRTIIRCLRRIAVGERLYDSENNNALKIYEQFNAVTKNIWSSDAVKNYIRVKNSKPHKSEIFKRFFEQNAKSLTDSQFARIGSDARKGNQEIEKKNVDNLKSLDANNTGTHQGDIISASKPKSQITFKEDLLELDESPENMVTPKRNESMKSDYFEGDKSREYSPKIPIEEESPERIERLPRRGFSNGLDIDFVIEPTRSFEGEDLLNIKNKTIAEKDALEEDEMHGDSRMMKKKTSSEKVLKAKTGDFHTEENEHVRQYSPQLGPKSLVKLSKLEEVLLHRRMITIKGLSSQNLKILKTYVNNYNAKHPNYVLRVIPRRITATRLSSRTSPRRTIPQTSSDLIHISWQKTTQIEASRGSQRRVMTM